MWVTGLLLALLFAALGLVFLNGKGAFLIAGYNTLSKAKKETYDEKALCRFMGQSMFVLAGCWLLVMLGDLLSSAVILWIGAALFLAAVAAMLIYANTGHRFRR